MKQYSFALALLATGCVADRFGNPNACDDDHLCNTGFRCVEGFCLAIDGGMRADDAGIDAGMDAGSDAGMDAGPACETEACYDGVPATTEGIGVCRGGCLVMTDAGTADGGTICEGQILPAALDDTCNGLDDDCDGMDDDDFDFADPATCGSCATSCADQETCCETFDGTTHECANTQSSVEYCGTCGNRCNPGQFCCGGSCESVQTDEANCGACGNVCGSGLSCCAGRCVDPRSTNEHCGACATEGGMVCTGAPDSVCCVAEGGDVGACRDSTMDECATCTPACTGGELCCAGNCLDVSEDDANCGGCGVACESDERCCGGTCRPIDDACGGCPPATGEDCTAAQNCCPDTPGLACIAETDSNNCGGCGVACQTGETCCGAAGCVSFATNSAHCGGCNRPCGDGYCSNGVCCPTGQINCGGTCIVPNSETNCGGCNVRCDALGCNCAQIAPGAFGCRALGLAC